MRHRLHGALAALDHRAVVALAHSERRAHQDPRVVVHLVAGDGEAEAGVLGVGGPMHDHLVRLKVAARGRVGGDGQQRKQPQSHETWRVSHGAWRGECGNDFCVCVLWN